MSEAPAPSAEAWRAQVADARRRGEALQAIDLARQGLEQHPGDLQLEYDKTLAYARAGATEEARANLRAMRAAGTLDRIADPAMRAEFGALEARLLKDLAYAATGPDAAGLAERAAAAYAAVHAASGGYFPAINAATLYRLAGDPARSQALATAALDDARANPPSYWQGATVAEAELLLGRSAAAETALQAAVAGGVHLDELASTRRQLAWLSRHLGTGQALLDALPAPIVLAWSPAPAAPDLQSLDALRPHPGLPLLAYGAILGPGDIAVAERLLTLGADLDLVVASKDDNAAPPHLLAAARSVTEVTLEGLSTEPTVARMAAQQARGLAAMRAAALVTTARTLDFGGPQPGADDPSPEARMARAFVFGDIKGFSTISEAEHRPFLDHVIGGFADALESFGPRVEYVETSGDGIYVVLTGVIDALRCCHMLQLAMDRDRLVAAGLPPLWLRLGAHVGPAGRGLDRVTGRYKFIGKEVIRTARIEAVTPVGQTYVTEQFASTLHATTPVGHACEYVGWQAMAKGFGRCRMYSLRATPQIMSLLRE